MIYRRLGTTDLDVSAICLGTMTWGFQNTEADAHEQMDYALAQGVNFFDTAEMYAVPPSADTYGKTETIIGTWFAARKNRDKVILATKIAGNGLKWIHDGSDINRASITASVEGSLKRLQTDYIDLYQLHWPNRGSYHFGQQWTYKIKKSTLGHGEPGVGGATEGRAPTNAHEINNFVEVLTTLKELIAAGKIRYVGLSNETAWGTMKYLHAAETNNLPRMQSIQNEYSLLYRLHEPDLMEISIREKVGLLAWSPLASGMLTGKYAGGARPTGSRWTLSSRFNQRDTPQAHAAVDRYLAVAKKYNIDVAQMAIAFVLSRPFVTAAIIGATSREQLKTNIAAVDLELSKEVLNEIAAVRRDFPMPF
ncbi:aldo/keto reductase [Turneriella parva]|uniref:Aldo/keto reductase n=1 Tax=Turneriella parva (strain ATCC BAA-1111 / DSM 21527 / NCTC 11395 / H) TaxID=869212 RepID=I4B0P3_TURPD|nr:aldo/keto reductase [Turneriella parva]AFM10850.1 aldo/keto reductase [Turneriella parva DSM 21527]